MPVLAQFRHLDARELDVDMERSEEISRVEPEAGQGRPSGYHSPVPIGEEIPRPPVAPRPKHRIPSLWGLRCRRGAGPSSSTSPRANAQTPITFFFFFK